MQQWGSYFGGSRQKQTGKVQNWLFMPHRLWASRVFVSSFLVADMLMWILTIPSQSRSRLSECSPFHFKSENDVSMVRNYIYILKLTLAKQLFTMFA